MTPVKMPEGVPVVVIDDFYTEEELQLIWNELRFLTSPKRLLSADKTEAAKKGNGAYKKTAMGTYLDTFYGNRESSDILTLNRKLFCDEVYAAALAVSPFYKMLKVTNNDHTLINYYDHTQEYEAHTDGTVFTVITTFYQEPVRFTGGDIEFPEEGVKVTKKNNRMVMFPGAFMHAITPVQMDGGYEPCSGFGRYGMAQFLTIK